MFVATLPHPLPSLRRNHHRYFPCVFAPCQGPAKNIAARDSHAEDLDGDHPAADPRSDATGPVHDHLGPLGGQGPIPRRWSGPILVVDLVKVNDCLLLVDNMCFIVELIPL